MPVLTFLFACGAPPVEAPPEPPPVVATAPEPPPVEPPAPVTPPGPPSIPADMTCPQVFTADHSNSYYAALGAVAGDDGCAFDAVRTTNSEMRLEWKKGEKTVIWSLEPDKCAKAPSATGGGLALTATQADRDACPKKWEGTVALLAAGALKAPDTPPLGP